MAKKRGKKKAGRRAARRGKRKGGRRRRISGKRGQRVLYGRRRKGGLRKIGRRKIWVRSGKRGYRRLNAGRGMGAVTSRLRSLTNVNNLKSAAVRLVGFGVGLSLPAIAAEKLGYPQLNQGALSVVSSAVGGALAASVASMVPGGAGLAQDLFEGAVLSAVAKAALLVLPPEYSSKLLPLSELGAAPALPVRAAPAARGRVNGMGVLMTPQQMLTSETLANRGVGDYMQLGMRGLGQPVSPRAIGEYLQVNTAGLPQADPMLNWAPTQTSEIF